MNCVQGGIRDVYAGGFEKKDEVSGYNWYGFFMNFGYVCLDANVIIMTPLS